MRRLFLTFPSLFRSKRVASQEGANVFFNFGDGNSLTLSNTLLGDLNGGDFDVIATPDTGAASASVSAFAFGETSDDLNIQFA